MAVFDDVQEAKSAQAYCAEIANFLEEHPTAWTRGSFAADRDGHMCPPTSSRAVVFCALGLLMRFIPTRAIQMQAERLLSRAVTPYGASTMLSAAAYNDVEARSVHDVILMFRAASYLPLARQQSLLIPESPDAWLFKTAAQEAPTSIEPAAMPAFDLVPDWVRIAVSGELLTQTMNAPSVAANEPHLREAVAA